MLAIFLQTLPFFAIIGLGYGAVRRGTFPAEAAALLTRFVFFFPLSAMLAGFAARLPLSDIFEPRFVAAYLIGTLAPYGLVLAVARARGLPLSEAAVEAHAAITGNTGFLGVPLLIALLGPAAAGPVMMVLTIDLVVFSSLVTLLITATRGEGLGAGAAGKLLRGLAGNPMIVSILAGFLWSATGLALPGPLDEFLTLLGTAATPCALFAIGASLAGRGLARPVLAAWLSGVKLALHPAAVALAAAALGVQGFPAGVMVAAAALPVAGNVYMLAQHYGVAPQRVSAAILISTAAAILTLPVVIALVGSP